MRVQLTNRTERERGAVTVTAALLVIPILLIAAFGIDFGNTYTQRQAYSTGADAGSLAIVQEKMAYVAANPTTTCAQLVANDTTASGIALAKVNANAPYGRVMQQSDVTTTLSCDGSVFRADVAINAPVSTSLGGLVGISTLNAGRNAQASINLGGRSKCGLCIIGPGSHDLQNGSVTVNQSGVSVNGTVVANPQGEITIVTTGTDVISFQGPTPNKGTYVPTPLENQPPIQDPLAALTLPPASISTLTVKSNPCTDGPGIYLNNFDATDPCNMTTGLYVFAGQFDLKNRTVRATGVTMYFTCKTTTTPVSIRPCSSSGEAGGNLQQAGNGDFIFSAPASGDTAGLALVADRNNTAMSSYRGSATGTSTGTIYMKSGTLDFRGTAGVTNLDSLVVTGNMTFSGQAPVVITYTDSKNVPIPATNARLTR